MGSNNFTTPEKNNVSYLDSTGRSIVTSRVDNNHDEKIRLSFMNTPTNKQGAFDNEELNLNQQRQQGQTYTGNADFGPTPVADGVHSSTRFFNDTS